MPLGMLKIIFGRLRLRGKDPIAPQTLFPMGMALEMRPLFQWNSPCNKTSSPVE